MSHDERVVLDTNVVVSGLLFPGSEPAAALLKAQRGIVLASEAIRLELLAVLARVRFDRYCSRSIREQLAAQFMFATVEVVVPTPLRICRDPRDDKFLEAAVHGHAQIIVTGDADLLALDPFRGIRILKPAAFLDWSAQ